MSFNVNGLVQPECGAPNPLVAAAQQITMKPAAAASILRTQIRAPVNFSREFLLQKTSIANAAHPLQSTSQFSGQQTVASNLPANLTPYQSGSSVRLTNLTNSGKLATDFLSEQELSDGVGKVRLNSYNNCDQQAAYGPFVSRPYMLDHSNHLIPGGYAMNLSKPIMTQDTGLSNTDAANQLETKYRNDIISQRSSRQNDTSKVDDVEFWQSLSQQYMGIEAYSNIAKMRAQSSANKADTEHTEGQADSLSRNDDLLSNNQVNEAGAFEPIKGESLSVSDLEYAFDERNPLKDQYEDPFAEGLKRLEQGDIPSAALLFEAAVQKDPENAVAWRYLGTTQAQNEKDTSAIRALRNCLKLDSQDQQARLAISVSLANEMYHHEACKHLLDWLMFHDKYRAVGASLEEFNQLDSELSDDPFYVNAVDQKHYNYVRDKFVEAARMSPTNPDPEVQSSLGVLFNIRGEYDKAVDCFKAALSVRSDDCLLWNRLGATLANGNKSDEAVIAYRKALEISPGFLRSRYNLAISLIHLNTYDEAAKQLVQILNMQAAGKGSKNTQIRTRSITSTAIWNTLRTVATLLNRPDIYPIIEGRDLARCNEEIFKPASMSANTPTSGSSTGN